MVHWPPVADGSQCRPSLTLAVGPLSFFKEKQVSIRYMHRSGVIVNANVVNFDFLKNHIFF
jgi:hypothetical protein